jgi:hypothetical protein
LPSPTKASPTIIALLISYLLDKIKGYFNTDKNNPALCPKSAWVNKLGAAARSCLKAKR